MNNPNYTIHQIFPILIYQGKMFGHSQHKKTFLDNYEKYGFDVTKSDRPTGGTSLTGEYRGLCLMHTDPVFNNFFKELTIRVQEYLSALEVDVSLLDIHVMKSWFTILESDHSMTMHSHNSADISFVYYCDTCETSGSISFEKPVECVKYLNFFDNMFSQSPNGKGYIQNYNNLTTSYCDILPVEGSLILFNSKIRHGVRPDETGKRRISIAGDIKLSLKEEYIDRETGLINPSNWRKF